MKCYYNPDHYCDMIDKECILHILSTLPIYPQAPFSLSLPLSPPPLSPSAQPTSSTSLLSPCGLSECQSIQVPYLTLGILGIQVK